MIHLLLIILCFPLLVIAMEQDQAAVKKRKTKDTDIFTLDTKSEDLIKTITSLIMEKSLDDFKANIQPDKLEYNTLERIKGIINTRKRALQIVSETRGNIGEHVDQIKEAIKKMPKQEQRLEKAFMPNTDKYIAAEKDKLNSIEAVVDVEFNKYTKESFTKGGRTGYTITKK